MTETPANFLCCDVAEENNEPQFGTAVNVDVWFMLEYTRPWQAKATSDNELSDAVQSWLAQQVEMTNGRLQFIRQHRPDAATLTFMVGIDSRLYEFQLENYEALLNLNMNAILVGDSSFDDHLLTGKRYFICTNGKRDRSCAIRGAATYRELGGQAGTAVWMTTHLGGHRFAPTLLSLPDGICYGRIHPQDVAQFIETNRQDEIWLDKLRGQTNYSAIVQVADYFLRQETENNVVGEFTLVENVEENGRWHITFQDKNKQHYIVTIASSDPIEVFPNSNNPTTKEIPQYKLVNITKA